MGRFKAIEGLDAVRLPYLGECAFGEDAVRLRVSTRSREQSQWVAINAMGRNLHQQAGLSARAVSYDNELMENGQQEFVIVLKIVGCRNSVQALLSRQA